MSILSHPMMNDDRSRPTLAQIAAAKQAQRNARIAAGLDPETGRFPRVPEPLRFTKPTNKVLDCHNALNPVILRFGLPTVLRCLTMTCAANGIEMKTWDDVAQTEEQQ